MSARNNSLANWHARSFALDRQKREAERRAGATSIWESPEGLSRRLAAEAKADQIKKIKELWDKGEKYK